MLAKQTGATEDVEKPFAIITSLPLIPWKHFKRYRQEPMIMGSWYCMKTQIVFPGARFDLEPHEFFFIYLLILLYSIFSVSNLSNVQNFA